jgi:hypothetical protein
MEVSIETYRYQKRLTVSKVECRRSKRNTRSCWVYITLDRVWLSVCVWFTYTQSNSGGNPNLAIVHDETHAVDKDPRIAAS